MQPKRVRHPTDRWFTFRCSPPCLAATQLLQVSGRRRLPGGDLHPSDSAPRRRTRSGPRPRCQGGHARPLQEPGPPGDCAVQCILKPRTNARQSGRLKGRKIFRPYVRPGVVSARWSLQTPRWGFLDGCHAQAWGQSFWEPFRRLSRAWPAPTDADRCLCRSEPCPRFRPL